MNTSLQIKTLTRDEILIHLDALAGILENCVNGGASVSFMLPFSLDKGRTFWRGIAESVARGERWRLRPVPETFLCWCSIPAPAAGPKRSTSVPAGTRWVRSRVTR